MCVCVENTKESGGDEKFSWEEFCDQIVIGETDQSEQCDRM